VPRSGFDDQLTIFDDDVRSMFIAVAVGVDRASKAFWAGDTSEAERLIEAEGIATDVLTRVEHELQVAFARNAPVARDMRFMLTVLRVVPQLERCVELAAHIAERAELGPRLPPALAESLTSMGAITSGMWEQATTAWREGDPGAALRLDEEDDELDVLADEATALLGQSSELGWTMVMEGRLVIRFYERLGDHAVHVCERIRWMATGK
jgi:phosphate transport system protein